MQLYYDTALLNKAVPSTVGFCEAMRRLYFKQPDPRVVAARSHQMNLRGICRTQESKFSHEVPIGLW